MPIRTAESPTEPAQTALRPFRVFDLMLSIAALFVAMAWDRGNLIASLPALFSGPLSFGGVVGHIATSVVLFLPFLVMASLAGVAFRLQPPRPAWRHFLQQPGAIACALASLAIIPTGLTILASHASSGRPPAVAWARAVDDFKPERLLVLASMIGAAVAMAWIVLKAREQWKTEPGWVDRIGRLVGWGWIAMILGGTIPFLMDFSRLVKALG